MRPDLVAIIGQDVRLRRMGRRWIGLCPLHSEKSPSFNIFLGQAGIWLWKCHGCGEGGDSIDYLRKVRGMSYSEAAKALGGSGAYKPDPALMEQRKAAEARERAWQGFLDRHPDTCLPRWAIEGL